MSDPINKELKVRVRNYVGGSASDFRCVVVDRRFRSPYQLRGLNLTWKRDLDPHDATCLRERLYASVEASIPGVWPSGRAQVAVLDCNYDEVFHYEKPRPQDDLAIILGILGLEIPPGIAPASAPVGLDGTIKDGLGWTLKDVCDAFRSCGVHPQRVEELSDPHRSA